MTTREPGQGTTPIQQALTLLHEARRVGRTDQRTHEAFVDALVAMAAEEAALRLDREERPQ